MQSEFVGKVFHFLRVQAVVPHGPRALRLRCLCVCGRVTLATPGCLRSGAKKSCGCWKRAVLGESKRTHGQANSRVSGYVNRAYGVWQAMRDRCSNSNRKDYHRYGGRGITVCKRWDKFENFLVDMGQPPPGLTLERLNNDGNYNKRNCVWATRKQQAHNSTLMVWVEHAGVTRSLGQWQKQTGLKQHTYYSRRRRGWSVKEALGLVARCG